MEITEVRITLRDEEKLKAFANVTFDDAFVVRGLKVINGTNGYFVSMPSRKRPDGTYQDIAHPINNEMRRMIEDAVLGAYENERQASASLEDKAAPTKEPEETVEEAEEEAPEETTEEALEEEAEEEGLEPKKET